jgi:translocation and assembly module TamB
MRFHRVPPPGAIVEPRRGARSRRWGRRLLAGLAALLVGAVVASIGVARELDRPWLKKHIQAFARTTGGVDIDFSTVRLHWLSGLTIEDLVVRSPAAVSAFAPELVRVGRLDARWSLGSLFGRGPRVKELDVSDVTLSVVVDEHGATSFDTLSPSTPGSVASGPPVPLSRQAGEQLRAPPPIGTIRVAGLAVEVIQTVACQVSERDAMHGVALELAAERADVGWQLHAQAGAPSAPLALDLARDRPGSPAETGRASLWLDADASSSVVNVRVQANVLDQTFAPGLGGGEWLHAEASARFDPDAGRTTVTVARTTAGDGAATAEALLEIPDHGDPVVRHAEGDVDVVRLLAWAPAGLVPITVDRARMHYRIDSFVAGPVLHFGDGGGATVEGDLAKGQLHLARATIDVDGGKVSLHGQPGTAGGIAAHASLALDGLRIQSRDESLAGRDLAIDFDGVQADDGGMTGRVAASTASVDVRSPRSDVTADGLVLQAHAGFAGHAPYAIDLAMPAKRLRVFGAGGRLLADAPARVELHLDRIQPDMQRPAASRGVARASLELGDARLSLDATKGIDSVDYTLSAGAASLAVLRPLLPPGLAVAAPWASMALAVRSNGHVEGLTGADPAVRHTTEIAIERPAYAGRSARSLALTVRSEGTAFHHQADCELQVRALSVDGGAPSDDRMTLSATLDRALLSFRLKIETTGRVEAKLSVSATFDRARRAVAYDVQTRLAGLAPLAPLASRVHGLEGFDLSSVALELATRGSVVGLVSDVTRAGALELAPDPMRTAAVDGTVDLRVAHLRWAAGDTSLETPEAKLHGDLHVDGARRTLAGHVDVDALHLGVGRNIVDVAGLSDESSAVVTGDLRDPDAELTQHATIRAVEQDFVPGYPVGDVVLTLAAGRDAEGLVHVSEMKVQNGAGGTSLDVTGGADLGPGRRRLSMTASLAQDLAALSTAPERFTGRGKVVVDGQVESPDLMLFRTRADLKAADVHVRMPRAGVTIESVDGDVPISASFELGKAGFTMRRDAALNPYSMLRFADQHPLLSRTGFISIGSVTTPLVSIAPLVGNLEIEQNVISLRQFEMGLRGGHVTGQCALDWDGPRSTVELHVRASGVQSSHGEPFDGNIAVVVAAGDRTVEGRAEVLRIGKRHLLDLLDLEDPLRTDPGMNRIRSALSFGYPDRLRLVFDHGFASARLELGGLARLISIGELRGIPMGPIVDKLLAPLLDTKGTP